MRFSDRYCNSSKIDQEKSDIRSRNTGKRCTEHQFLSLISRLIHFQKIDHPLHSPSKVQYCDEEMEHETVKKIGTLQFSSFCSQCRQAFQGLINTTSSYCLLFKIWANRIDLESLKVLIFNGLQTPPKLSFFTIFF